MGTIIEWPKPRNGDHPLRRPVVICDRYLLGELLGRTKESAVYLTSIGVQAAALKLAPVDKGTVKVSGLDNQHLIRLHDSGVCELGHMPFRYFVTELADKNLGTSIAGRPLSPEGTLQMLGQVLEALVYLHERELAHGRIKPSNILTVGDSIKLSVDSIRPADALASAAEDMRALGLTVIEALTLHRRSSLLASIPQPFREVVGRFLERDPAFQWTARQAATWLFGSTPESSVAARGKAKKVKAYSAAR